MCIIGNSGPIAYGPRELNNAFTGYTGRLRLISDTVNALALSVLNFIPKPICNVLALLAITSFALRFVNNRQHLSTRFLVQF